MELRNIGDEEAREEIIKMIKESKKPVYYSDMIKNLHLDLMQVVRVVEELEEEGLVAEDGVNIGDA